MKRTTYDRRQAEALLPLLDSILREIEDRTKALVAMERRHGQLEGRPGDDPELLHVIADMATYKRELRHAREELEQLGCSLEDCGTLGVRIPGENDASFVWQPGHALEVEMPSAA